MRIVIYSLSFVLALGLVAGCGRREDDKRLARMLDRAVFLEEEPDSLVKAAALYKEIAGRFPGRAEGRRAADRAQRLERIGEIYRETGATVEGDSAVILFCKQVLGVAPDFRPAVRRLGSVYHEQIDFLGQLASSPVWHSEASMNQVWSIWREQDQIWSNYDFRVQGTDRDWGDRLCVSAQVVANMLGRYDRFADALATVQRGLSYSKTDRVAARAKVDAAYYSFWVRNFEETTRLSKEALDSGLLEREGQAKAYHMLGMGYAYLYLGSKDADHMEKSIRALNESLQLDDQNKDARELLRAMREAKEKLSLVTRE